MSWTFLITNSHVHVWNKNMCEQVVIIDTCGLNVMYFAYWPVDWETVETGVVGVYWVAFMPNKLLHWWFKFMWFSLPVNRLWAQVPSAFRPQVWAEQGNPCRTADRLVCLEFCDYLSCLKTTFVEFACEQWNRHCPEGWFVNSPGIPKSKTWQQ